MGPNECPISCRCFANVEFEFLERIKAFVIPLAELAASLSNMFFFPATGHGHSFGHVKRIVDTLHFVEKVKHKNSLEKFYIYSGTIRNNQNKEESTTGTNKMYDIIIQHEKDRRRHWTWACLPIHSLPKSHPSSPQVNIAPTPHCIYDTPTYQNTKILAQHTK